MGGISCFVDMNGITLYFLRREMQWLKSGVKRFSPNIRML